jgi:hypothetical protein
MTSVLLTLRVRTEPHAEREEYKKILSRFFS